MTTQEKSYLAGIIDGEGSIMLTRFHQKQLPSPCISISSVSLELLDWVRNKTGVGTIKAKKNYMPERHKDSYAYTARYNDAIYILEMVEPFLVISQKKLRAQMILKNYKSITQRNGRYTSEQLKIKEAFYLHFMSL